MALASLMRGRRTLVLSGAGISTESGIPDYRGPLGTLRNSQTLQYRELVGSNCRKPASAQDILPDAGLLARNCMEVPLRLQARPVCSLRGQPSGPS